MTRRFVVPGDPMGKERPRVAGGHAYTPRRTAEYEARVRMFYLMQCHHDPIPAGQAVRVTIRAVFKPPERTSKARLREMMAGILLPAKRPDWDNIGKIVCDSLNGTAWHDDAQITTALVYKRYGMEPCVDILIEEDEG